MNRSSRMQYSEPEAAQMLKISVEELRLLVREHIVQSDDPEAVMSTFEATDLVVLRIFAGRRRLEEVSS